jgi:hypothetical protein
VPVAVVFDRMTSMAAALRRAQPQRPSTSSSRPPDVWSRESIAQQALAPLDVVNVEGRQQYGTSGRPKRRRWTLNCPPELPSWEQLGDRWEFAGRLQALQQPTVSLGAVIAAGLAAPDSDISLHVVDGDPVLPTCRAET